MKLYAGIDLHSNNSYVVVIDENDKILFQKRVANDVPAILNSLDDFKEQLIGVVIESTYNWYWLADGLQLAGYKIHLANTNAISQYNGLKHTDDKSDARWLAHLLKLGILAEGYIYPKEERGLRELVRKRMSLVKEQTRCILMTQGLLSRYVNCFMNSYHLLRGDLTQKVLREKITDKNVRQTITSQLVLLKHIRLEINQHEKSIKTQLKKDKLFLLLKSIPGVGDILSMTIRLETGEISRFSKAGKYSSYCRCVESKCISNGKKKAENNRRNGNAYLGWAFIEAANCAIRTCEPIKQYYQRKQAKTKRVIALKAIANKLARASYFIQRDNVEFDMKKAFG